MKKDQSATTQAEMVTITKAEYEGLQDAANELAALESAGVDNWEGYYERWDELKDISPESYKRLRGED